MGQNPAYEYDYILKKLLELAYDGIVVVDVAGIITLISKAYTDFLGIHFLNPPTKLELVEIIATPDLCPELMRKSHSSDWVKCGKFPKAFVS